MHRDLKPQNIILDQKSENAVLKLADFGLAKYAKNKDGGYEDDFGDDEMNTVCGTPVYWAPEIGERAGYNDKADLWSIGVIFLEMLVGTKPWEHCENRKQEGRVKKEFWKMFAMK